MHDPDLIWRFGRWIARRKTGSVRLAWSGGELLLGVRRGSVVSLEGPDSTAVAAGLGCEPVGHDDLLREARELAFQHEMPESRPVAAVKEILQDGFGRWLEDSQRSLELEDAAPEGSGPTISLSHAIVELLLSDSGGQMPSTILPNLEVILRRAPNFLDLYSPLRLSEEADLVVAKITGQRTASEIASRSPHGSDEVLRLIAALVATGMLEPVSAAEGHISEDALTVDLSEEAPARRQLPVRWIGIAAAALVALLAVLLVVVLRPKETPEPPELGAAWGVVVDMGCEPEELQRVLKKARQNPESLRPVQADTGDENPCWRLVWGRFATREEAEGEAANVPERLLLEGFQPHAIELPEESPESAME